MVSDLIDFEKGFWNVELIEVTFSTKDAQSILAIPLNSLPSQDEITWAYSKDGLYSVKTSYMLGKGYDLANYHQVWTDIWGLEAISKVKHFIWRIYTDTLPLRATLKQRHITDDDFCLWCLSEDETLHHAMFNCWRAAELWEECGVLAWREEDSKKPLIETFQKWKKDAKVLQKCVYLMWNLWRECNHKVFEGKSTPNSIIAERLKRQIEEYGNYAKVVYTRLGVGSNKSSKIWRAPPRGVVKINTDASLITEGWVGLSAVARDHEGTVIFAAVSRCRAYWAPEIAEAKAMVLAAKLAKKYAQMEVIFESDCKCLVSCLGNRARFLSELDGVLGDFFQFCSSLRSFAWSHVCREGNFVAHHLARIIPFGDEQVWENHAPGEITTYVLMDKLTLND